MVIGTCSIGGILVVVINGYWWLFYQWLLVTILLVAICYFRLNYHRLFMDIGDYFRLKYHWWLFY
jgi:hypothetical protein